MEPPTKDRPPGPLAPARAARLRRPLSWLLEALVDAERLGRPARDCALDVGELHEAGLQHHDLRWLVLSGHVEVTPPPASPDAENPTTDGCLVFLDHSRFWLTAAGIALANRICQSAASTSPEVLHQAPLRHGPKQPRPRWNKNSRELWLGNILVKRFDRPAPLLERILDTFEEEHWAKAIDDPLSLRPGFDPKQRLRDAIRRLNSSQMNKLLRFRSNGEGTSIRCELT